MDSLELRFHDDQGTGAATVRLFASSGRSNDLTYVDVATAAALGQESVQLIEDGDYEYALTDSSLRLEVVGPSDLLRPSHNPSLAHCGRLLPGSRVGRLRLRVRNQQQEVIGSAAVEIRSRKLSYDDEFRRMLEDITRSCVDLALDLASPTELQVIPDPSRYAETLYQQFAFVRGLLDSESFSNAVRRIVSRPYVVAWREPARRSVHRPFRARAATLQSLMRSIRQVPIPQGHPLSERLASVASHVEASEVSSTPDNAENRFIKFALLAFNGFLRRIADQTTLLSIDVRSRFLAEVDLLRKRIDHFTRADLFRQVGDLTSLPLGSTVLQRREGYREVYEAWLRFGLAARLTWAGGDAAYGAGQRDAATLYEYWAFFRLLSIVSDVCRIIPPKGARLLERTADGFGLRLRRGKGVAVDGVVTRPSGDLRVRLDYNRTFRPSTPVRAGSWTRRMRPDYTLSLWPASLSESDAETTHEIVHVHFDAKYRVEFIDQLFGREESLFKQEEQEASAELEEESIGSGRYKREDLLKMHAYRDAIRRSYGAYVLYPGTVDQRWELYHELLPGLGAFVLRPGRDNAVLDDFIRALVEHVADRGTSRATVATHSAKEYGLKDSADLNIPPPDSGDAD